MAATLFFATVCRDDLTPYEQRLYDFHRIAQPAHDDWTSSNNEMPF